MNKFLITEEKLQDVCYDLYKEAWTGEHISYEEQFSKMRNFIVDGLLGETEAKDFDEYLWETDGYSEGMMYASKDEFLETEYLDRDYIGELLDNKILMEIYDEYNQEQEIERD